MDLCVNKLLKSGSPVRVDGLSDDIIFSGIINLTMRRKFKLYK